MKILVTGAGGFIGKNLTATLNNIRLGKDKTYVLPDDLTIYEYGRNMPKQYLDLYCRDCDFVFHLAGVNRPKNEEEFMDGNYGFTSELLDMLKTHQNSCPVMFASSIQAQLDNPYGRSKKAGEEAVFAYGKENYVPVYVYRFPNVFGKWCKPDYNSVVATFCSNIANDRPIQVNDRSTEMELVYIDDVIAELAGALLGLPHIDGDGYCYVPTVYTATLGEVADLIQLFKKMRENGCVPDMTEDGLTKRLYATYLSYLPADRFRYALKMNVDQRGSFTEMVRTAESGQFSVNISKPGVVKGEHWHHTKNEKFIVVSGKGLIQLRRIDSDEIISFHVTGDKIEAIDIPVGYTHNIINEGDTDLVTFMWCSECFHVERPDTYYLEVNEEDGKN